MNKNTTIKKYQKAVCAAVLCIVAGMTVQNTAQAVEWKDMYYTQEQENLLQKNVLLNLDNIRSLLPEYLLKPFSLQSHTHHQISVN